MPEDLSRLDNNSQFGATSFLATWKGPDEASHSPVIERKGYWGHDKPKREVFLSIYVNVDRPRDEITDNTLRTVYFW